MKKLIIVVIASLLPFAAGCSSSSSAGTTSDGGPTSVDTATLACNQIKQSNVQVLLSAAIKGIEATGAKGSYQCRYDVPKASSGTDNNTLLSLYGNDASETDYNRLKTSFADSTFTDLGGVGDKAYWFQSVDGNGPPAVVAHKGSATCVLQVTGTLDLTTLAHTQAVQVSPSDAAAFAGLMGAVCTDYFSTL